MQKTMKTTDTQPEGTPEESQAHRQPDASESGPLPGEGERKQEPPHTDSTSQSCFGWAAEEFTNEYTPGFSTPEEALKDARWAVGEYETVWIAKMRKATPRDEHVPEEYGWENYWIVDGKAWQESTTEKCA